MSENSLPSNCLDRLAEWHPWISMTREEGNSQICASCSAPSVFNSDVDFQLGASTTILASTYFPVAWSSNCAQPISVQASLNLNEFSLPYGSAHLKCPHVSMSCQQGDVREIWRTWGAVIQAGTLRVRFPMSSLHFSVYIFPRAALMLWGSVRL
jgi:hypothetical protein